VCSDAARFSVFGEELALALPDPLSFARDAFMRVSSPRVTKKGMLRCNAVASAADAAGAAIGMKRASGAWR